MFYGRMEELTLESPAYVKDAWNHEHVSYTPAGRGRVYIVLQDKTPQTTNELDLFATNLVGYTQEGRIKEGWRIGGKYVVSSIIRRRHDSILYLKAAEDGV